MQDNKQYSDEHLNAFIDDQLSTAEKAEILDAVRHNAELSQRVCKLQKLQNLVQLSYQSIDIPDRHQNTSHNTLFTKFKWFAAASVLLTVGSIAGWVSHKAMNSHSLTDIAQITQNLSNNASEANDTEHWKLMLHVSTANPNKLDILLDEAETLLKHYSNSSRQLELEILANSEGLALVSDNGKSFNKRLEHLQKQYQNLAVLACGQTLARLQRSRGKKLTLLPNTQVVSSALKQIVKRQQTGWSYIRI